ncbi:MAG: hypothetical protein LIO93_12310, partial [Bacteroidales bacterium]|nr:hypothetical protein [Bacteroidales bacterium]
MDKERLYKLIDYLLLNAFSVNSLGLYNGKAGMSLCLFEAARLFEDDRLEEYAFELIQEAIVLTDLQNDHSFQSGLSGIGFVVLYLLKNGFLEGNFKEFFGTQLEDILSTLNNEKPLRNYLLSIYFLS